MSVAQLIGQGKRGIEIVLDLDCRHIDIGAQEITVFKAVIVALGQRKWWRTRYGTGGAGRGEIEPWKSVIRVVVFGQMEVSEGEPGGRTETHHQSRRNAKAVVLDNIAIGDAV